MYLATLPLRLAVVSIVSSCLSSLLIFSDGLLLAVSTTLTLITESLLGGVAGVEAGADTTASSGIGDMKGA